MDQEHIKLEKWKPHALDTTNITTPPNNPPQLTPQTPPFDLPDTTSIDSLEPVFDSCDEFSRLGELDRTKWTAWDNAVAPVDPKVMFQYMHSKAGNLTTPGRTYRRAAWVKPATETSHHHIPHKTYLWARNIIRSAKNHMCDRVVLISFLGFNFLEFDAAFRSILRSGGMTGVSPQPQKLRSDQPPNSSDDLIAAGLAHQFSNTNTTHQSTSFCLNGDIVYIAFGKQLMLRSVNGRAAKVFVMGENMFNQDENKAVEQQAALVEVADLFIAVDDALLELSSRLHTPTIALLSDASAFPQALEHMVSYTNQFGLSSYAMAAVAASLLLHHHHTQSPDLTFHSYVDPTMGYGSSAEDIVLALSNAMPPTRIRFFPSVRPRPPFWETLVHPRTREMIEAVPGIGRVYLGYFVPHEDDVKHVHWMARKAVYSIVYTTFETTVVPRTWPELINNFDKLLVSCDDMRDAFVNGGVSIPVEIVPLGVSVSEWPFLNRNWNIMPVDTRAGGTLPRPSESDLTLHNLPESEIADHEPSVGDEHDEKHRRRGRQQGAKSADAVVKKPATPFRFLMYADGTWLNHRKDYELALKAFLAAFPNSDSATEFWIKVTDFDPYLEHINASVPAHVNLVVGRLPQRKLLAVLASCHCLVFPSHGEGFGLPPREAMATGIPSIHAGFAGLAEVSHPSMSIPLPFSLVPASGYDVWYRENANSTDFGLWAGISGSDLAAAMRTARVSENEVRRRGFVGAVHVRTHETYTHVAERIRRSFGGLLGIPAHCAQAH